MCVVLWCGCPMVLDGFRADVGVSGVLVETLCIHNLKNQMQHYFLCLLASWLSFRACLLAFCLFYSLTCRMHSKKMILCANICIALQTLIYRFLSDWPTTISPFWSFLSKSRATGHLWDKVIFASF